MDHEPLRIVLKMAPCIVSDYYATRHLFLMLHRISTAWLQAALCVAIQHFCWPVIKVSVSPRCGHSSKKLNALRVFLWLHDLFTKDPRLKCTKIKESCTQFFFFKMLWTCAVGYFSSSPDSSALLLVGPCRQDWSI